MHRRSVFAILLGLLVLQVSLSSAIAYPNDVVQVEEVPPSWPEGSAAYDNMVAMADFGYRKIDTQANFAARDWIAEELSLIHI